MEFRKYLDAQNKWRWTLNEDGRPIAVSSARFLEEAECDHAISRVRVADIDGAAHTASPSKTLGFVPVLRVG